MGREEGGEGREGEGPGREGGRGRKKEGGERRKVEGGRREEMDERRERERDLLIATPNTFNLVNHETGGHGNIGMLQSSVPWHISH